LEQGDIIEALADHRARLVNLEGWQKVQNGTLQRIEDRMNKLYLVAIGLLCSVVGSLAVVLVKG
jgi:hypothetical protein